MCYFASSTDLNSALQFSRFCHGGHPEPDFGNIQFGGGGVFAAELAPQAFHVGQDALTVGPLRELPQGDVFGSFINGHAFLESLLGLALNQGKIVAT